MKKDQGFTLVELILYITIVVIILSALIPFALDVVGSGAKSSVQEEVTANARYISERIKYEIRNATTINSVTSSSLSLATSVPATNPTVIDLSGSNIRITQGSGSPIILNSNMVSISGLTFTNFISADTKTKNIQFVFTTSSNSSSARQEYQDSVTVEGDAELRSN